MLKTVQRPVGKSAKLGKAQKRVRVLFKKGRFKECTTLCGWVHAQGICDAEFLHLYGMSLKACGNPDDALAKVYAAHEQEPANAKFLNSLGLVFVDLKDTETAIEMFKRATSLDEKYQEGWLNLGRTLRIAGRHNAAELALNCAAFLDRSKGEPLVEMALLQIELGRYNHAAETLDDLLKNHRQSATSVKLMRLQVAMELEDLECVRELLKSIGKTSLNEEEQIIVDSVVAQVHVVHDEYEEAIAILEKTVAKRGRQYADHVAHLAICYGLAGRIEDGIAILKDLTGTYPEHASARRNLAKLQFRNGDIAEGFENYEARTQLPEFSAIARNFEAPAWQGEPVRGKRVLVWREQGIGDEVLYASLLPELHARGCSITFQCSPKLMPLWRQSFPWADIRPDGEETNPEGGRAKEFDFHVPIGSLGRFFRTSVADFHENQKPWIARNGEAERHLRNQLAIRPEELLVGVCWRSTLKRQATSRNKVFLDHSELAPLKDLSNVRWLNLQYASEDDEIEDIRRCGLDLHHYTNLDQMNDLVGACNLIGACDLVISVSVSVMDLAGGVGTPMVLVGPEASAIYLGTDHVPWFANCKVYPIKGSRADQTVANIAGDWPDICQWAENLKPEDRKTGTPSIATTPPLDLEYQVDSKTGS